jgi:Putative Flp pilus-assembly TadE/G-like
MRRLVDIFGSERGGVLVVVAVFMASGVMLLAFSIDVGHWFEHKRHLQAQVDSGAFAGATNFNGCISASAADRGDKTKPANVAIQDMARKFSGDTVHVASALNAQVNNRPNVTVVLNSTKYPSDGGLDYSDTNGPFCKAGYVDVKATDDLKAGKSILPWNLAGNILPRINAHARVSIFQVGTLAGSLPLAVEDVNPLATGALVVNEDAASFKTTLSAVLGRQVLTAGASSVLNGQNLTPWTGGPVSVTIPTRSPQSDVGVVIALCSNKNLCGPTKGNGWLTDSTKTLNDVCSQLYVTCHAGDQTGLEFIHGYSTTGNGSSTAPILRSVTLTKGGSGACTDDSAPYFMLNGGCKVGVTASLDFGITTDPSKNENQNGINATVKVDNCTLAYVNSTLTTSNWSAANCETIANGAGQKSLALDWTTQTGSGKNKVNSNGTFPRVARPFANDGATATQSYPIEYAQITQGATCTGGVANSLPFGAVNLCVGVGVVGNLKVAADSSDPTKLLRFGNASSHTGAVDCGPGNLYDQIVNGCSVPVQVNPGEACPNATNPVDCLPIITGVKRGQEDKGMDDRWIVGGVCPPNHWPTSPGQPINIPEGDPRVTPLIVTLYNAFAGSGSGYVPVTDFAVFYVTGWDSKSNACNGINEAAPSGADNGTIWGHFIHYVGDLGNSLPGGTCNFTLISPCITVLTE